LLLAVLVVLLLGLLFGGYRKGTVVNAPNSSPAGSQSVAARLVRAAVVPTSTHGTVTAIR
jgi:hypothetical protein